MESELIMKKTKYYVNGKLVRTSRNSNYEYAIIWYMDTEHTSFKLIACSETMERINKRFASEYNYLSNEGFYSSTYGQHSATKAQCLKVVKLEKEED